MLTKYFYAKLKTAYFFDIAQRDFISGG